MKCAICGEEIDNEFPARCFECNEPLHDDCAIQNKFKCTKCTGGVVYEPTFNRVRRSYLELYKKCPYSFNLQMEQGMVPPNNVYAEIGIWLHEVFDRESKRGLHSGEDQDGRKNAIIQEFTRWFQELPNEIFDGCQSKLSLDDFIKQQHQKGVDNIHGFFNMCMDMPIPWKTEEELVSDVEDCKLQVSSTFDRIDLQPDGTYDLLDYKTGAVYVGKKLSTDLQPALYIYLVEKNYGIKINRFRFLFTGENKERTYIRCTGDTFVCTVNSRQYKFSVQKKMEEVKSILLDIESGKYDIPLDLHEWYCKNQCGHFKMGACTGKFLQEWKQK